MNYKKYCMVAVTMVAMFSIITSSSFLGDNKVFAQSSIFGNLFGSTPSSTPSPAPTQAPSTSNNPFSGLFGSTPSSTTSPAPTQAPSTSNNPLSSMFGGMFGSTPSSTSSEPSSPTTIDKPCHPGSCLGTPGFYTVKGHHHCYEGTSQCIQTSHFNDKREHY
jgi:hypothetical protein